MIESERKGTKASYLYCFLIVLTRGYPPKERGVHLFESSLFFVLLYNFFGFPTRDPCHYLCCGWWVVSGEYFKMAYFWRVATCGVKLAEEQLPIIQKSTSEKIELEAQAPLPHTQRIVLSCLSVGDV